jgi:hypothetical protein
MESLQRKINVFKNYMNNLFIAENLKYRIRSKVFLLVYPKPLDSQKLIKHIQTQLNIQDEMSLKYIIRKRSRENVGTETLVYCQLAKQPNLIIGKTDVLIDNHSIQAEIFVHRSTDLLMQFVLFYFLIFYCG